MKNVTKKKILIFAGTTEGRQLAEYAKQNRIPCIVSTATEYGSELLKEDLGYDIPAIANDRTLKIICGRMDQQEMEEFFEKEQIGLVIDATHPFAVLVTENIRLACENCGTEYVRCLRDSEDKVSEEKVPGQAGTVICVESIDAAVDYLERTHGNILITTGSKELKKYTRLTEYKERCYARVLSVLPSVTQSIELGFSGNHLIAMQGPFSLEMNLALIHQTNASYFVTKESGKNGGFEEKMEAAEKAGAVLVVIGRPREQGLCVEEVCEKIRQYGQRER